VEGKQGRERGSQREGRDDGRMEGGDGGRQQVVVMHRATFLATLSGNKGGRETVA